MELEEFIESSPLAEKIKLPGKIIVHRNSISPKEIACIVSRGEYTTEDPFVCELELGGEVVAYGKIEEKDGEFYFVPEITTEKAMEKKEEPE